MSVTTCTSALISIIAALVWERRRFTAWFYCATLLVLSIGTSKTGSSAPSSSSSNRRTRISLQSDDYFSFHHTSQWDLLVDQLSQIVNVSDYVTVVDSFCDTDASSARREATARAIHAPFCRYSLAATLRSKDCAYNNASLCRNCVLKRVLRHDLSAAVEFHRFQTVLDHYDCGHGAQDEGDDEYDEQDTWSNQLFTCSECATFYKDWLCAVKLRVYVNSAHVPPCLSFCTKVTEACPFFVPEADDGSGEPLFICSADDVRNYKKGMRKESCYTQCHLQHFSAAESNYTCIQNDTLIVADSY